MNQNDFPAKLPELANERFDNDLSKKEYKLTIRHPMRQFEFVEIESAYYDIDSLIHDMEEIQQKIESRFPANLADLPTQLPQPVQPTQQANPANDTKPNVNIYQAKCERCGTVIDRKQSKDGKKYFYLCTNQLCDRIGFFDFKTNKVNWTQQQPR